MRRGPLKVAIVVPFSWSFPSGVLRHAEAQARVLIERGAEVRLVCGRDPADLRTSLVHTRSPRRDEPPDYVVPVGRSVPVRANGSTACVVCNARAVRRLRRLFEHERFDVVHVHHPLTPVPSALALAIATCPTVVTCHSGGSRLFSVGRLVFRPLIDRIDYRIAVSEEARRTAEPYLGGPFEILPNGVEIDAQPQLDGRANRIVFVGRADPRKGLDVLLRAWPAIHRDTGARLRLIGPDPPLVRSLQSRLGIADGDGIDSVGPLYGSELRVELASARALVAPSLGQESFGMVLTEAFAAGTPVVASHIPGYVEVVTPETGLLVPPGDPEELATAVVRLLRDEPARRARGAAAHSLAEERYDWRPIADRLLAIYSSLTAERRPS